VGELAACRCYGREPTGRLGPNGPEDLPGWEVRCTRHEWPPWLPHPVASPWPAWGFVLLSVVPAQRLVEVHGWTLAEAMRRAQTGRLRPDGPLSHLYPRRELVPGLPRWLRDGTELVYRP
jgi:hypothetical protein